MLPEGASKEPKLQKQREMKEEDLAKDAITGTSLLQVHGSKTMKPFKTFERLHVESDPEAKKGPGVQHMIASAGPLSRCWKFLWLLSYIPPVPSLHCRFQRRETEYI